MSFEDDVRRLSQEEGLFDREIAEKLDTYRVKVSRCRQKHNIPRPNLNNRRDKQHRCKRCGRIKLIRRKEKCMDWYCDSCAPLARADLLERKRKYMRTYKGKKVGVTRGER
jgi:hypothetical protein